MTRTELLEAALIEIGVVADGDPIPAEYIDRASAKYDALYEMLTTEGLVTWTSDGDIPTFAQQPVTSMLAYLCAAPFQLNPADTARLEQAGALTLDPRRGGPSLAERQLRRQLARNRVPWPAQSEYF